MLEKWSRTMFLTLSLMATAVKRPFVFPGTIEKSLPDRSGKILDGLHTVASR